MTQNVVTYTVEVNTDNDDGKLLPYLTANAKFMIGRREDVLLVPNAALRWSPQAGPDRARDSQKRQRGAVPTRSAVAPAPGARSSGTVWVRQGKFVRPIRVNTGLTDGAFTEITARM